MKTPRLTRRNFLQLAALTAASSLAPRRLLPSGSLPNIIIVVFDAWSAKNVGLFGYPRDTMPHLSKLSEQAIVYHNHYAAGPWTIPGTASLLTGTFPWTHRSFNSQQIGLAQQENNLFRLMQNAGYATFATSHNMYADMILSQFNHWLDLHPHYTEMFLPARFPFTRMFNKDLEASGLAQLLAMWNPGKEYKSSLFLGDWLENRAQADLDKLNAQYGHLYPRGIPAIPVLDIPFLLEDGIDHLLHTADRFAPPQLSYYHYYPPHQPYRTQIEFIDRFKSDGVSFPEKPRSIISEEHDQNEIDRERRCYDETLLYVDSEFHRLHQRLKASGQLENTWLVLTSDHGELFERGNIGHETPMGYDPEVRVPLLIFPPGQNTRVDVHDLTSAVDVLPTILHLTGQPVPEWAEGVILPPFNSQPPVPDRSVFVLHPRSSRSRKPISEGAVTIVRNEMKLIYSFGMPDLGNQDPFIELYDLSADPEELDNLYTLQHPTGQTLLEEILSQMAQADQPYR